MPSKVPDVEEVIKTQKRACVRPSIHLRPHSKDKNTTLMKSVERQIFTSATKLCSAPGM